MQIYDIDKLIGGWFVGDFQPTCYKTRACEVSYKQHYAGEKWAPHFHKLGDEINYLIEGSMSINDQILTAPCVFVISKGEISAPIFHTDVKLVVVKVPGEPGDKYIV